VPVNGGEAKRLSGDNSGNSRAGMDAGRSRGSVRIPPQRQIARTMDRQCIWGDSATVICRRRKCILTCDRKNGKASGLRSLIYDENIWRLDLTGDTRHASAEPVKLIASTWMDNAPQYSPDGKKGRVRLGSFGQFRDMGFERGWPAQCN
jgi:hypothetical protein